MKGCERGQVPIQRERSIRETPFKLLPSGSGSELAERGTYRRIAGELRLRIELGELPPGSMVPSELTLTEQYSVARGTVRSALALLAQEGLIEVMPGQGRRVVGDAVDRVPETAYERIVADLQRRLDTGEFGPADPLPSEAKLMAKYQVSRNTVRRAYRQLVEDGVVVIRHGAGAFPATR
jgi:DNA-binding GntR family transcriptional regulator